VYQSPSPKPNLLEVTRGLDNLGLTTTALDILREVGIHEISAAAPTGYAREKQRSAYIHVKVEADADQQRSILRQFHAATAKRELSWMPVPDGDHLVEVVLPKAKTVYAYRVPLDAFQNSKLPALIGKSKILEAYTRKPRADAQHHKNKE
jgi:hypothetical protein